MNSSVRVPRRRRGSTRRSAFLSARVSDETRHKAEVLSRYHERPISEVIEIALRELAAKRASDGGLVVDVPNKPPYTSKNLIDGTHEGNLADETWSPDAWRRSYEMWQTCPELLSRAEIDFWRDAQKDPQFRRPQTKEERAAVECEEDDGPVFEPALAAKEWERRFGDSEIDEN